MSSRKPFIVGNSSHLLGNIGSQISVECFLLLSVCVFVVDKPVVSVDVEPVLCTKVSMELFDPIYSCGILRPSGHVVKCFHDVYPDYDELRQVTVCSHPPVCLSLSTYFWTWSQSKSPSVPPDVAGRGLRALLRGWEGRAGRVSVSPLQAPMFRRRALSVRRHH